MQITIRHMLDVRLLHRVDERVAVLEEGEGGAWLAARRRLASRKIRAGYLFLNGLSPGLVSEA
jgi:hypothetical protein